MVGAIMEGHRVLAAENLTEIVMLYSEEKLGELILYICGQCRLDRHFGAVKLNKYLFFSDFTAYQRTSVPITGAAYQKLPKGPAPRRLLPVRDALLRQGSAVLEHVDAGTFWEKRLVPLREPNLALFSAPELAIVSEIIETYRDYTAKELSDVSHEHDGWRLTANNQTIPYFSALLPHGSDEIPERILAYGHSISDAGRAQAAAG